MAEKGSGLRTNREYELPSLLSRCHTGDPYLGFQFVIREGNNARIAVSGNQKTSNISGVRRVSSDFSSPAEYTVPIWIAASRELNRTEIHFLNIENWELAKRHLLFNFIISFTFRRIYISVVCYLHDNTKLSNWKIAHIPMEIRKIDFQVSRT